jgi:hypothetical protein
MTSQLTIDFADDMPAMAVEIVAPDLEVVSHAMLERGQSRSFEVPSEASFLRVHLPNGRIVTLEDAGNLHRTVTLAQINARLGKKRRVAAPAGFGYAGFSKQRNDLQELPDGFHLRSSTGPEVEGYVLPRQNSWANWEVAARRPPRAVPASAAEFYLLHLPIDDGAECIVRLPGSVRHVAAMSRFDSAKRSWIVHIKAATLLPDADTILGYLHRSDLYSAQTMAESLPPGRLAADPFGTCVAQYLMLRLKRPADMATPDGSPPMLNDTLPDACVIAAWQFIQEQRFDAQQKISTLLLRAAGLGLPVYTEGLRLLLDGLEMLGVEGRDARRKLLAGAGAIRWDAPFTTTVTGAAAAALPDFSLHMELGNY